jgi:TRAP-type mannitol/chloroaromatic compound transport system permease small subunit
MHRLLSVSQKLARFVETTALSSGLLFFVLTAVIVFDVVTRKFGYQLPGFGSTRLQELEWHLHAAIFAFWLGFAYVRNAHVRIDVITSHLRPRAHAWLELFGCLALALPYCLIAVYFTADFAWVSFFYREGSESASGLPWRFIPKGVIALGFALLLVAVLSVVLRVIVYLFGPAELRRASAFAGATAE